MSIIFDAYLQLRQLLTPFPNPAPKYARGFRNNLKNFFMEKHESIEALQAFIKLQTMLSAEGLQATNKQAVKKSIKKNNSSEPQKEVWSSWCTDGQKNFLAFLDNGKLKLITKDKLENYIIKSIKNK